MNRALEKIQNRIMTLAGLETFLALFCMLLIFTLNFLFSSGMRPAGLWAVKIAFLLMSVISGFWAGLEFPLCARIFGAVKEGVGRTAGILYASDLLGAWAGALLAGVVFIPVLGILETCGAIILLKLASLSLLGFSDFGSPPGR
jgi:spermidine synthase